MNTILADVRFADPPSTTPTLSECSFYHCIDLPGMGLQRGSWDLRGHYDEYFGGHDFAGERVLDLGAASGALTFEIERRGAREIVAFDLADDLTYDCRLPIDAGELARFRHGVRMVKNAFWLAHSALGSRARVVYGHVGQLPPGLGQFDTVMMGNVLQHLQDPVGAVLQAIQHTNHLIITEADWLVGTGDDLPCLLMYDLPTPFSWYQVKPRLLQNLLSRWGFTAQTLTRHTQLMIQNPEFGENSKMSWSECHIPTKHFTLSARRPA